jgi:hypothetical protein
MKILHNLPFSYNIKFYLFIDIDMEYKINTFFPILSMINQM